MYRSYVWLAPLLAPVNLTDAQLRNLLALVSNSVFDRRPIFLHPAYSSILLINPDLNECHHSLFLIDQEYTEQHVSKILSICPEASLDYEKINHPTLYLGFALCRALLRQKNRLPLDQRQRPALNWTLTRAFRRNARLASPSKIIGALRLGYEVSFSGLPACPKLDLNSLNHSRAPKTLKILKRFDEHPDKLRQIFDLIAEPRPPKQSILKRSRPRVWPHPNNKPVLSRPFLNLTGRRRVPKFTIANKLAFLRFTKPQSPFLGRIIRDRIDLRTKQTERKEALLKLVELGRGEDLWDRILKTTFDIRDVRDNGPSWMKETYQALYKLENLKKQHDERSLSTATKMFGIVQTERALAELEKRKRRYMNQRIRILAREEAGSGPKGIYEYRAVALARKIQEIEEEAKALVDSERGKGWNTDKADAWLAGGSSAQPDDGDYCRKPFKDYVDNTALGTWATKDSN